MAGIHLAARSTNLYAPSFLIYPEDRISQIQIRAVAQPFLKVRYARVSEPALQSTLSCRVCLFCIISPQSCQQLSFPVLSISSGGHHKNRKDTIRWFGWRLCFRILFRDKKKHPSLCKSVAPALHSYFTRIFPDWIPWCLDCGFRK